MVCGTFEIYLFEQSWKDFATSKADSASMIGLASTAQLADSLRFAGCEDAVEMTVDLGYSVRVS